MIVPDVNLLLYANDERAHHHSKARAWLESLLSGTETVGFAWAVLVAFVRLTTNQRLSASPMTADEALDVIDVWLARPCARVVAPGQRHAALLRQLLAAVGTAGNLANDAHLAALAIELNADLHSADTDFSRFAGLRWVNPLDAGAVA